MTSKLRKAGIGALAALTLGAGLTATATPSAAHGWRGGYRWHNGYWYRGYGWRGGYGWGAPVAAGIIGGLALGALAGAAYPYGPAYYGGCYWQNRPVYDSWGNFAGYAPVQACY
jgi:hypothetical protein